VGSLGGGGAQEYAEHITVKNCTFNGADSAVRIKTWPVMLNLIENKNNYSSWFFL
jgi:hypothetical protein